MNAVQVNEFKMVQQCYGLATRYAVITKKKEFNESKTIVHTTEFKMAQQCYGLALWYAVITRTEYCAFLVLLGVKANVSPLTRNYICITQ